MSVTPFTLASGTRVYLDPHGKIPAVLLGSRTVTIEGVDSNQALAEVLLAESPANYVLNESALLYTADTDHKIKFGAGAIPIDQGSNSPSASNSASPSAS